MMQGVWLFCGLMVLSIKLNCFGYILEKIVHGSADYSALAGMPCKAVDLQTKPHYVLTSCILSVSDSSGMVLTGYNGSHCVSCNFSVLGTPSMTVGDFNSDLYLKQGEV